MPEHGGRPPRFDPEDCKAGHAVECGVKRFTRHRAVATRYDELAVRYAATSWSRPPTSGCDQHVCHIYELDQARVDSTSR